VRRGKEHKSHKKASNTNNFVERPELNPESLRISGKILEGPEDIPHGSYHTLTIEQNDELLIIKGNWLKYQLDRVKEHVQKDQQHSL